MTSQIVRIDVDGSSRPLGQPALFVAVSPSPDGRFLLVEAIHRPFSYLVPYSRFPLTIEVWDAEGRGVADVAELPLADDVPKLRVISEGGRLVEDRFPHGGLHGVGNGFIAVLKVAADLCVVGVSEAGSPKVLVAQ